MCPNELAGERTAIMGIRGSCGGGDWLVGEQLLLPDCTHTEGETSERVVSKMTRCDKCQTPTTKTCFGNRKGTRQDLSVQSTRQWRHVKWFSDEKRRALSGQPRLAVAPKRRATFWFRTTLSAANRVESDRSIQTKHENTSEPVSICTQRTRAQ